MGRPAMRAWVCTMSAPVMVRSVVWPTGAHECSSAQYRAAGSVTVVELCVRVIIGMTFS